MNDYEQAFWDLVREEDLWRENEMEASWKYLTKHLPKSKSPPVILVSTPTRRGNTWFRLWAKKMEDEGGAVMPPKEFCCNCGAETDKAGPGEDSLFDIEGDGPYCEECWDALSGYLRGED